MRALAWAIALTTGLLATSWADDSPLSPQTDPRLERSVSVFAPPTSLSTVVRALSSQSGVLLTVERRLAEYQAILVVEERPLHEVMRQLAEAFGFRWERRGKAGEPPTYLLVQPAAQIAQETAELREMERLAEEMWRYAATQARRWASLSKKEIEARMEELRQTYEQRLREGKLSRAEIINLLRESSAINASNQPWRRAAILALASLSPAQVRQLREGAIQVVTGDALPPQALGRILEEWREVERPVPPQLTPDAPEPDDLPVQRPYQSQQWNNVEVWLFADPSTRSIKALVYFISPEMRTGGNQVHEVTPSDLDLFIMVNGLMRGAMAPRLPESPTFGKPTKAAEFNRLTIPYLLDPLGVELAHFAQANRVALAAEWYPFALAGAPSVRMFRPLSSWSQVLMALRDQASEMVASEDWVVVRHVARPIARRTHLPAPRVAKWLLKPEAEGMLTLDDIAEIAFLPDRQRETVIAASHRLMERTPQLGSLLSELSAVMREPRTTFLLQAYASLPAPQKRLLRSGQPVPLAAMPQVVARRLQVAAALPSRSAQVPSLAPAESAQMALVMQTERGELERIDWTQVPEQAREEGAFRAWLESLSAEDRAKVTRRLPTLYAAFGLTDGNTVVTLARISLVGLE